MAKSDSEIHIEELEAKIEELDGNIATKDKWIGGLNLTVVVLMAILILRIWLFVPNQIEDSENKWATAGYMGNLIHYEGNYYKVIKFDSWDIAEEEKTMGSNGKVFLREDYSPKEVDEKWRKAAKENYLVKSNGYYFFVKEINRSDLSEYSDSLFEMEGKLFFKEEIITIKKKE